MHPEVAKGTLIDQVLERPLRPGEVSLDDLERAFRETETEAAPAPRAGPRRQAGRARAGSAAPSRRRPRKPKEAKAKPAKKAVAADAPTSRKPTRSPTSRSASTWTRWNI